MDTILLNRTWISGQPVQVDNLMGTAFTGEAGAHTFIIAGKDAYGNDVPITGQITAKFLASNQVTVPLVGSIGNDCAFITLSDTCYLVPGRFVLSIFATNGNYTTCIYCGVGNVFATSSNIAAYPTMAIPDLNALIQDVQAAISSVPADYSALINSIASTFDPGKSGGYGVGEYVWYNGLLYRFKEPHTGGWQAGHVDQVILANDLTAVAAVASAGVRYDIGQGLSDAQKATARANINAQEALTIDAAPTEGSTNPVQSGGVYSEVSDLRSAIDKMEGPATSADVGKSLLVKTVANGKVTAWEYGEAVTVDDTLTQEGQAADAKAVGDAIAEIGTGLTEEAKAAILACFRHVAWTDGDGQIYYTALLNALYENQYPRLVAMYTPGTNIVYIDDSIETLRNYLLVKQIDGPQDSGTVVTDYTLTGTLHEGVNGITIHRNSLATVIEVNAVDYYNQWQWSLTNNLLKNIPGSSGMGTVPCNIYISTGWNNLYNRRAICADRGRVPYQDYNTSNPIANTYPVPVPSTANKVTVSVTPATQSFGVSIFELVNNVYERTVLSGTWEHSKVIEFTPKANQFLLINCRHDDNNGDYEGDEPSEFTINYEVV